MKIYDSNDQLLLDIAVDDSSYRYRAICGDHNLILKYSLAEHLELPVGAYCDFEGERFTLIRPEHLKMKHTRAYEYTVTFSGDQDKAKIWKFRNPVDGRLRFFLTAKPREHLQMFVDNMNRRDSGWSVGDCIEDVEKMISYDHDYCWDALSRMASEFETEFEIVGKKASLHKVEYNKSNPLSLSYGKGKGFKSGVGRSNSGDTPPVEILYVQGGDRNIDRSKYPEDENLRAISNGCLLLPAGESIRYDGEHFEDEEGFISDNARTYQADDLGLSIRNIGRELSSLTEDSLDRSDDYPKRVGKVGKVVVVDEEKNFYDIIDGNIPEELNYEDYLIKDEQMTIIFQSGMLAGREFDVKYYHNAKTINGVSKEGRRFEIVPQEIDGITMPGGNYIPNAGDEYAVFNVMLPPSYIRNDTNKSGSSWDMFRSAVRYLFDNEDNKFTFTGELDGIWAKKDWANIGGRIFLGSYIRFRDDQFEKDGVLVRITAIKEDINNPHSPKIELSNETISASVSSTIKNLESTEVVIEENHKSAIRYAKRRWRDAKETIDMISDALSDNFENRINPIAVETMAMLVGDERLQYQFVASPQSKVVVTHNITWNNSTKQLTAPAGTIQHLTLGIDSIRPDHDPGEYRYWNVSERVSGSLYDDPYKYYLYIKAVKEYSGNAGAASFILDTSPHEFEEGDYYWLLVGILNSEYEGERSFVTLYGFTEILPGRITADRLVASDGESYFDMVNAAMKLKDKFIFNENGDGQLKLRGTIVQSIGGEDEAPIGCYRGEYNDTTTYFNGDEVRYQPKTSSPLSTYRCVSESPITGVPPTNTLKWQPVASGVKGDKGDTGANGADGKDGVTYYTWIKYADSATGSGLSDSPVDKSYIGFAYNKTTPTESTNPADYSWTLFKGTDGSDGIPGEPGADGTTYYTWIKYSDVANPTTSSQIYDTPKTTTEYIGIAVNKLTATEGTNPSDYTWSKFKGDQGVPGADGVNGTNGADGKDGANFAFNLLSGSMDFIGTNWALSSAITNAGKYMQCSVKRLNEDLTLSATAERNAIFYNNLSLDADTDYTLSFWARGNGNLQTFIFSNVSSKVYYPQESSRSDTYAQHSLDGTWRRYRVNFHTLNQTISGKQILFRAIGTMYFEIAGVKLEQSLVENTAWSYASNEIKGDTGAKGDKGDDGAAGNYTEYRFAVNSSPTSAPSLNKTALEPSGWNTSILPSMVGYYHWMTQAIKNGEGTALLSEWSDPIRITPRDGAKGDDGNSPVMVYRGVYSTNTTYYGNEHRRDVVKYNNTYYITRIDAGEFQNTTPTSTTKWNAFGASFESVATQLLLAEHATIGNWFISGDNIASTHGKINNEASDAFDDPNFVPDVILNGKSGLLQFSNGMQLDTKGLILSSNGNPKLKVVNAGIGSYSPSSLVSSGTRSISGTLSASETYNPSNSTRSVGFGQAVSYILGFMKAGSTIKITRMTGTFTVPTGKKTATKVTANGSVFTINILRDGDIVSSKQVGFMSGVTGSVSQSLSASYTYTIPEGGDGGYTIEICGGPMTLTVSDSSDYTNAFNLNVSGSFTFNRGNFESTILGNDGMLSSWGSGIMYFSQEGFIVRVGNYAIRITSSGGIQKTSSASSDTGWTSI